MFAAEGLFVIRYDNRDVGLSSSFAGAPVGELGQRLRRSSDMAADGDGRARRTRASNGRTSWVCRWAG
jgi:hypothetical protein